MAVYAQTLMMVEIRVSSHSILDTMKPTMVTSMLRSELLRIAPYACKVSIVHRYSRRVIIVHKYSCRVVLLHAQIAIPAEFLSCTGIMSRPKDLHA